MLSVQHDHDLDRTSLKMLKDAFATLKQRPALFLDFDGTLVDLAPTPDLVEIDDAITSRLNNLIELTNGAMMIVTGRGIDDICNFLPDFNGCISGEHGMTFRSQNGAKSHSEFDQQEFESILTASRIFCTENPTCLLEIKQTSLSFHFRSDPEIASEVENFARHLLSRTHGFMIQFAKMAIEIKPKGSSKGLVIQKAMALHPFKDRIPVFAGDDVTDETAFDIINEMQGLSIKIGKGQTKANYRLSSPTIFNTWLDHITLNNQGAS